MSDAVFTKVLTRFITLYGEPKTDDVATFMSEYENALEGFKDAILDRGVEIVLKSHQYPTWPTIGECVAACGKAAEELVPRVRPAPPPDYNKQPIDPNAAKILRQAAIKALNSGNAYADIVKRCPPGGTINVSAPWGEEVRDASGNIVPIRNPFAA